MKKFRFRFKKADYTREEARFAFFAQGLTPGDWELLDSVKLRYWVFKRRA